MAASRSSGITHAAREHEAYAERWIRTVRSECLRRAQVLGLGGLRRALADYTAELEMMRLDAAAPCPGSPSEPAMTTRLGVGEHLPDIILPAQNGEPVRLLDRVGPAGLVVFFYPKDGTAVCTREACSFRDSYEDFRAAGADVVGISSDSTASHEGFAQRHRLPFTLLSDADGTARKRFGVPSTLGLLPGRVTYVVDLNGIVRHVFSSQFRAEAHVREALAVLARLRGGLL